MAHYRAAQIQNALTVGGIELYKSASRMHSCRRSPWRNVFWKKTATPNKKKIHNLKSGKKLSSVKPLSKSDVVGRPDTGAGD